MRVAVWVGGRDFAIEQRPLPEPGPGEVRVRVGACGVCLTDVHTVDDLLAATQPPRVLGHEWSGVVDAVGEGVAGVASAAGVAAPAAGLAPGTAVAGGGAGGFAEYLIRPAGQVFPLPPGVPPEHGALLEPIECCAAAVQHADLPLGASVLLTGAGPMGLLTLQLARRGGAARALVSEPNAARRELALRLGAERAIDPRAVDVRRAVDDFTAGRGVDAAFECAGQPQPLADCLRAVVRQGTVVMVGVNARTARLELDLYDFHYRYLRLVGVYGGPGRGGFRAAVSWLGQLELAPLISHRFELAHIAQAFEIARTGQGMKVLVSAGGAA